MAKYKVLQKYTDQSLNAIHEVGTELEMTVVRAEEIEDNLKPWGGPFLERLDAPKGKGK